MPEKEETKVLKKCFVVTPIGNEADPIRRHVDGIIDAAIIPALGDQYEIRVAHKIATPGSITKQVIEEIYKDDLVIANLTHNNPNVMYELAFRHSLGKPVIIIAEDGTKLPFDITDERTVFYKNDAQGVLDLRKDLKDAEKSIDFNPEMRSGMIYDMMRQIDVEAQILKNAKRTENKEDGIGETLKYILQRLDNLDRKSLVSQETAADHNRLFAFEITYDTAKTKEIDFPRLARKINSQLKRDNINVRRISPAEPDSFKIVISAQDNAPIEDVYKSIVDTITAEGVVVL